MSVSDKEVVAIPNEKKAYSTPKLMVHGDLRKLTQGGLSGVPETNSNQTKRKA